MKLLALVLVVGCNDLVQLEPDPLGNLVRLEVSPKAAELVITDLSQPPAQQPFRAIGVFSDGARRDVTQQIVWNVDNPLPGGFPTPGMFTTSNQAAGAVTVLALADDVWTTADVTVRIDATVVDGVFPPSDPNLFDNAKPVVSDPQRSPAIVYPSNATLFPQGLPNTVYQWTRGTLNDAFRITVSTDLLHLTILTGADRWETSGLQPLLSQSNQGDLVTIEVDAAAAADPGTIYQGAPIGVRFAHDAPDDSLYFWSGGETNGIMRGGMAASFAGKLYPADGTCVGCHTVSRDGARLAMGYGAEAVSLLQSIDAQTLGTQISKSAAYDGGWTTYSPDGGLLLIANQGNLFLRDAMTGMPINGPTGKVPLPMGHFATHPDWSPDGRYVTVAYTSVQPTNTDVKSASIARLLFDETTRTFSGPQILVAATAIDNYYFPRYSPDGSLLAFVHATEAAHGAPSAELQLVASDGGLTSHLDLASHRVAGSDGVPTASQMPSWAPFKGDYAWLAFSSSRPYGVVLPSGGRSQIWVTAIDLAHAQPEVDSSAASFWLPCQDVTVSNNNPAWAPSGVTPE